MNEIWKPIPGRGDYYEASSLGRIRSVDRCVTAYSSRGARIVRLRRKGQILKLDTRLGYKCVTLYFDGKEKKDQVHSLVLMAFIGERPTGYHACHNNGIKDDNRIENLRWDTPESNMADIAKHGNRPNGSNVKTSVLTKAQVLRIKHGLIGPAEAIRNFLISRSQFYRIKNGQSWKHLDLEAA